MSPLESERRIYGLFAQFKEPESLLAAAVRARKEGYKKIEAFSPYPVAGIKQVLDFPKDRVALATLMGGIIGGMGGFFMQWYANVIDYPLNVGGRPDNSWPSFIPITFELTILGAALSAGLGMLAMNGLPKPYYPTFNAKEFLRASKDGFFLCINADDPQFDRQKTTAFLCELRPQAWGEIPDED
jgi:hypothetical protein